MQTFDIYVFTETWLNAGISDNDIKVTNFKDPFRCNIIVRSGGVAIYVKESLNVMRRRDLELKDLELKSVDMIFLSAVYIDRLIGVRITGI